MLLLFHLDQRLRPFLPCFGHPVVEKFRSTLLPGSIRCTLTARMRGVPRGSFSVFPTCQPWKPPTEGRAWVPVPELDPEGNLGVLLPATHFELEWIVLRESPVHTGEPAGTARAQPGRPRRGAASLSLRVPSSASRTCVKDPEKKRKRRVFNFVLY